MIRGYCIGGGLMAALKADIRIASDDAQFGIPAARLGLGYGYGGVEVLVNLVGPAAANEILFSARRFSADEALRMGLVNRVVAASALEPAVVELARTIADNAPLTVRAAKFAIRAMHPGPRRPRPRGGGAPRRGVLPERRLHRGTARVHGEAPPGVFRGERSSPAFERAFPSNAAGGSGCGRRGAPAPQSRGRSASCGAARYRCSSSMSSGSGMTTNSG